MDEDEALQTATTRGSGQSVNIKIDESAVRWGVIVILAFIIGYAAVEAHEAAKAAEDASMWNDLVYSHLVSEEAWLRAHDVPVDKFGPIPKPPKGN